MNFFKPGGEKAKQITALPHIDSVIHRPDVDRVSEASQTSIVESPFSPKNSLTPETLSSFFTTAHGVPVRLAGSSGARLILTIGWCR